MKFNCIEIRPNGKKWYWSNRVDNTDRQARPRNGPNPAGFYYYPQREGVNKGFMDLKKAMIKAHKGKIAQLKKSLVALEKLEMK